MTVVPCVVRPVAQFYAVQLIPTVIVGAVLTISLLVAVAPFVKFYILSIRRWWRGRQSRPMTREFAVSLLGRVKTVVDNLLGIVFSSLFYTYFMVVKSALDVFDCVSSHGEQVLRSSPNVKCDRSVGQYATVYPFAVLSLIIFGAGVPAVFGSVLFWYRSEIRADQEMKARGEGNSEVTNPNLWVRRRFRKLYEDFKPETAAWRMVLMARKLFLAWASIMFNEYPMFQVRRCFFACGMMCACYVLRMLFHCVRGEHVPLLPTLFGTSR